MTEAQRAKADVATQADRQLASRHDDLELELRRIGSVVAVALDDAGAGLLVEIAVASGTEEPQLASVRERAELLARGCADQVTVRVHTIPEPPAAAG
jgi:hypothetical protein